MSRLAELINEAKASKRLVRIWRAKIENGSLAGYVEGVGKEFICVALVDDEHRPDGHSYIRHLQITKIEFRDRQNELLKAYWSLADLSHPKRPSISLLNSAAMFADLARVKSAVLHCGANDDAVCYVGKIKATSKIDLKLRYITPDGEWDGEMNIPLREINMVDVGAAYQRGLALVASNRRRTLP